MKRSYSRLLIFAKSLPLLISLLLPSEAERAENPAAITVYRHATLVDVTQGRQIPNIEVVVEGQRISSVTKDDNAPPSSGTRQVNLSGRYILPGLIDAHVHLATPPNRRQAEALLRRNLYGGVIAVRDMADDLRQVSDLARAALAGEIPAPDIYYAALFAGPTFFSDPRTHQATFGAVAGKAPWLQAIDSDSDLRMNVALARGTSATAIKFYADLSPDLVRQATVEAHRQGMRVWAHATLYPARPQDMVAAGVDSVSHVGLLIFAALPPIQSFGYYMKHPLDLSDLKLTKDPIFPKLFRQMRNFHVVLDATMHEEIQSYEESADKAAHRGFPTPAIVRQLLSDARQAGVDIDSGTDFVADWRSLWPEVYEEMHELSAAGFTNAEVLRCATVMGARALGQDHELGAIEAGKLASFIVVDADPLLNLENLKRLAFVVKRGRESARVDYKPLVQDDIRDY